MSTRSRGRSHPDGRRRLPCLPFDRRSAPRPLRFPCFGGRGERVWGAWGISRPGERRPANRCPSASGTGRNAIRAPGGRWIHHESDVKAHGGAPRVACAEEASPALPVLYIKNGRRSSLRMRDFPPVRSPPRRSRVAHREIFGENAFPAPAPVGSIMEPNRSCPAAPHAQKQPAPAAPRPAGIGVSGA